MSQVVSVGETPAVNTGEDVRPLGPRWSLLADAGGGLFGLLLLAGLLLQAGAVGGVADETRAEVVARFSDGGNELRAELGALLVGFGAVCALGFLASLRAWLSEAEGDRAVGATAAFAGGVAMVILLLAASAASAAAFSSYDYYEAYEVEPDAVLLVSSLSFYAQGFALIGGSVLVAGTSIVARRWSLLPRWFTISGLVLAAVLAFGIWASFLFLALPLLVLWILTVSAVLVVRGRRKA